MSVDDFRKVILITDQPRRIGIERRELEKIQGYEKIKRMIVKFEDDRLVSFAFEYDEKTIKWRDAGDFTRRLPEGTKLLLESWAYSGDSDADLTSCENFYV